MHREKGDRLVRASGLPVRQWRYERNEFSVMFEELNLSFSHQEILKAIAQLRTNKSAGPDKLLNEFFINGKEVLSTTLLIL